MAAQETALRSTKSIAGAALAALGMFILYENVTAAVAHLSHILGHGSQALGRFPAFVLAVSQALHIYSFYHHQLLQGLFQQLLASSWPLLLIIFGTVLSTDNFSDESKARLRE
jgi:hypothetical protein